MAKRDIGIRRIKIRRGLYIVKRGGIWYAEMCRHGVQTRRSLDTSDPTEATRRAASGEAPPGPEPRPAPKPASPALALGTALTEYEEWYAKNRRASGAHRALPVLRLFVAQVGEETDTRAVTRPHVQQFVEGRRDGRSGITVRGDFAVVRAFLRWIAGRKGTVDWNVCRGVETPKDDELTREAPSLEKVNAVLRALDGSWLRDYCTLLAETGMRPTELLGIRGTDLRGRLLSIVPWEGRQLKSKWSRRVIELNENAAAILRLREGKMFDKARPVFANEEGNVYKEASISHHFQDVLGGGKRRKPPEAVKMTLYDFRHFFCSEHAAPGPQHMEIEALAAYIGHSPASTQTLLRWYADQRALRRGAPTSLVGEPKEGKIVEMKRPGS
jgi:integrase